MNAIYTGIIISPDPAGSVPGAQDLSPAVQIMQQFSAFDRAVAYLKSNPADIAFADISRNPVQGLKWAARIKNRFPETRIFLLDRAPDPETIVEGFRAGALDFIDISAPKDQAIARQVKAALDRERGGAAPGELISLFSLKGGMGLTTVAINLADQIVRASGDKVLLLDLNLFTGDIATYLDIRPQYSPYDLAADFDRMDAELLFSSLFRHDQGFYILTASEEINDSDSITTQDLTAMVSLLKTHFDYVVADLPHDFSRRTLALMDQVDTLMVLAQQHLPSVKSVQKILEFLEEIRFDPEKISLVLNRHLKSGGLARTDLEVSFGKTIDHIIGNDYPACIKAANVGATLGQTGPRAGITEQMARMARSLTGTQIQAPTGLKALFSRVAL